MCTICNVYTHIILSDCSIRQTSSYVILIPQAQVLCLIYTHKPKGCRPVCIYQAKHECLRYKCYVPHYPWGLIACQYEVEIRIYHIDRLGKFDYGPAHVSMNHRYTYVCQQKRANPIQSVESSYKQLNSCFVATASFHKVYYTSKGLAFFLKRISRVFQKLGVILNQNGAKHSCITWGITSHLETMFVSP